MAGDVVLLGNGTVMLDLLAGTGIPPYGTAGYKVNTDNWDTGYPVISSQRTGISRSRSGDRLLFRDYGDRQMTLPLTVFGSSRADLMQRVGKLTQLVESAATAEVRQDAADARPVYLKVRLDGTAHTRYALVRQGRYLFPHDWKGWSNLSDVQPAIVGGTLALECDGAILGEWRPFLYELGATGTPDPYGGVTVASGHYYQIPAVMTIDRAGGFLSLWPKFTFANDGVRHVILNEQNGYLVLEKTAANNLTLTITTTGPVTKSVSLAVNGTNFATTARHHILIAWGDNGLGLWLDGTKATGGDDGSTAPIIAGAGLGGIGGVIFMGADTVGANGAYGSYMDVRLSRNVDGVRIESDVAGGLLRGGAEPYQEATMGNIVASNTNDGTHGSAWDLQSVPGDMEPDLRASFAFVLDTVAEPGTNGIGRFTLANRISPASNFNHLIEAESFTVDNSATTGADTTASGGSRLNSAAAGPAAVVPTAPTVVPQGTTGTAIYSYAVSALLPTGWTPASGFTTITTGNDTLDGTNFNRVTATAVTGALAYAFLKFSLTQAIGIIISSGVTFDDQGQPPERTSFEPGPSAVGRSGYKILPATGYVGGFRVRGIVQKSATGAASVQLRLTQSGTNDAVASPVVDLTTLASGIWLEVDLGRFVFPIWEAPRGEPASVTLHLFDSGNGSVAVRWDALRLLPFEEEAPLYAWSQKLYSLGTFDRLVLANRRIYRWNGDPAVGGYVPIGGNPGGGSIRLLPGVNNRLIPAVSRVSGKVVKSDLIHLEAEFCARYTQFAARGAS